MTIDEKIQAILLQMQDQTELNVNAYCKNEWDETEVALEEIKTIMLASRTIKPTTTNGFYNLTLLGERILANGGWVKFSEERVKNIESQKERAAEYDALKTANEAEKLANEAANKATLASHASPTGSGGMSFQGVLILIAILAAIAVLIWVLRP
jgi:hypothetical protein